MGVQPEEMTDYLWLHNISGTVHGDSGFLGEAGKFYAAPDGLRFFYGRYGSQCIYSLVGTRSNNPGNLGKFYMQDTPYFGVDLTKGGWTGEYSKSVNATKAVIEGFMDIFMGVLSCAGGPVAMGITGMNILVSTGNVVKNYDTYKKAIEVLLYNSDFIEQKAPTFYAVVILEVLTGFQEKIITGKIKDTLLDKLPGPKAAGKIVGVFVGKIGEDRLAIRLKALNKLFKEVLIKVADHASKTWPNKLSNQQVSDLAKYHVTTMLNELSLLKIDQGTAEKIIREVADNCLGLQNPLKKISAALDLMK